MALNNIVISPDTNSVSVTSNPNKVSITNENSTVNATQETTRIVQVNSLGPVGPSGRVYTTTSITSSTGNITTSYNYYGVNYAGEVTLSLPDPTSIDGYTATIKDESGNSSVYNIILSPTVGLIDGNSSVLITRDYMSLSLVARNNNWWII